MAIQLGFWTDEPRQGQVVSILVERHFEWKPIQNRTLENLFFGIVDGCKLD